MRSARPSVLAGEVYPSATEMIYHNHLCRQDRIRSRWSTADLDAPNPRKLEHVGALYESLGFLPLVVK